MSDYLKPFLAAAERLATSFRHSLAFVGLLLVGLGVLTITSTSFGDSVGLALVLGGIVLLLVLLLVLSGDYGRPSVLPNIAAVSEALRQAFSSTRAGAIHQTFVGANLIAGRQDFIRRLPEGPEGHIEVTRYFFVSTAFDINFAAHSIAFEGAAWQKGVRLRNYVWMAPEAGILAEVFWNLTSFPDRLILTMSSRDDQKHGKAEIIKDSDSKDVVGLAIGSRRVGDFVRNYYCERLTRATTVTLRDATARMHERDCDLFLSAALHAVVKEWCGDERFKLEGKTGGKIASAALVGTFARRLSRRKDPERSRAAGDQPRSQGTGQEIDLLVFVRNLEQTDVNALTAIAFEVLGRFEVPDTVSFLVDTDMSPVGMHGAANGSGRTSIQLIINDAELANSIAPSRLVASHRVEQPLMIKGSIDDLRNSYRAPAPPTPDTLLNEELGVDDLLKQLEAKSMKVRYWRDGTMHEREQPMRDALYSAFARYSIKWIGVNLRRVLGRPTDPDQWHHYWQHHRDCLGIEEAECTPETAMRIAQEVQTLLQPGVDREGRLVNYRLRLDEAERRVGGAV